MAESEALKILKRDLQIQKDNKVLPDGIESLEIAIKSLEEIQAYRAIGTVEEFKALKEKAEPKKPLNAHRGRKGTLGTCPCCSWGIIERFDFCPKCLQKIDWQ